MKAVLVHYRGAEGIFSRLAAAAMVSLSFLVICLWGR